MDQKRHKKTNCDKKKMSSEQMILLLDEIEKDPTLVTARNSSRNGRIFYMEKWERVSKMLNEVEKGCVKSVRKWQQALRDWRSNTKRKASKTSIEGATELSKMETRLLSLCEKDTLEVESKSSSIEIGSIAEVDPLSSSDESHDDHDAEESEEKSHDDQDAQDPEEKEDQPTVYVTEYVREYRDGKRNSTDDDEGTVHKHGTIKRRRVQMFPDDTELKTEILSRLSSLEASKEEATRQAKMLENIAVTLDRYVTATDRQAEAIARQADVLSRIVDMLERITGLANGVAN